MEYPVRKHNRLNDYDYSQNGAYFITICTEDRKCLLATVVKSTMECQAHTRLTSYGQAVEAAIRRIPECYQDVRLEKYVIMPNHVHLLLMIDTLPGRPRVAPTVSRIIQQTKGQVTKKAGRNLFQKSFHDRIIRNDVEYQHFWQYIDNNPTQWELDELFTEE